jgi:hypothetical protein
VNCFVRIFVGYIHTWVAIQVVATVDTITNQAMAGFSATGDRRVIPTGSLSKISLPRKRRDPLTVSIDRLYWRGKDSLLPENSGH